MADMETPDAGGGGTPPPASNWSTPPPAAATAVPGAPGFVYADVPNRIIALIIDWIVLVVASLIVGIVLGAVGLNVVTFDGLTPSYNIVAGLIYGIVGLAISLGYFVYTWTSMRATVGMKVLGMQVGDAAAGATLTRDQGIRRWIALWGPGTLATFLNGFPAIGILISLAAVGWAIYLLYTTYQSPTKQGWHDVFANTVVVKAARTAG